ncbi:vesicle-fusing ATPase [Ectocarpus siliculosus]|uniref:Vesicle-fusing ATPase n=1 Tax=Ectocarpus siliculosus TaxID=2880 RepID=D8LSL6_ECTSI|nr:vesicle-fusing ATPase [Ectocarpus siliculosus]|eukprot:CBN77853.1 vesicle-fusing ATPase [Ectocarpus siliculosus]
MGLQRQHHKEHQQQRRRQETSVPGYRSSVGSNRCRVAQTHQHQAHKTEEGVTSSTTTAGGRSVPDGEGELTLLDELLERCAEATKSDAAAESSHTGSSEWAGFKTAPELLEGVRAVLSRARQRSRHSDGSALAWSWLTLSPRPVRVAVATPEDGRVGVYLTVLPAGNGNPPSHRPMYGCHMLSRVLAGEVEQVKSNSKRVIGRSTHSLETPVWSSFGGGARRLINESFQPAIILEVVMYDWSRGSGYSGSYAAPGTSSSGSAELRAEAEGIGRAEAAGVEGDGGGESGPAKNGILPIVAMDACPCPPALLFRDGDVYEEEEGEEDGGRGLTLVRSDGGAVEQGRAAGEVVGGGVEDLLTADGLACDVGGLDGQLEDIVRRVLSTRSIPTELRQALGVGHVRGLLLHGPPGCGKTLLARELSRRLGARPPKLVSGPEILDKWVGEAERKVRLLFLDAELDHERCVQTGEDPAGLPLNLICFDEIDALCRSRGSLSGDTSGVRDSVVNQILSKMDGLVNLQNVLVVGMTNRKELLDEALLRPGRMEVCMPIPLPDAAGREQILAIHLRKAREAGLVSPEVTDAALGKKTGGFSGADLAGLVRSATSFAIADWRGRLDGNGEANGERAVEITAENFEQALREVDSSGGGRRGRLSAIGGAVRGGLARVLRAPRGGG